jgi:hypothetical protein
MQLILLLVNQQLRKSIHINHYQLDPMIASLANYATDDDLMTKVNRKDTRISS